MSKDGYPQIPEEYHANCGQCAENPKEREKQYYREQREQHFEEKVKHYSSVAISTLRKVNGERIGEWVEAADKFVMDGFDALQSKPKGKHRAPRQPLSERISPRKAVAKGVVASTALSALSPMAPAVASEPVSFNNDLSHEIARNLVTSLGMSGYSVSDVEGITIYEQIPVAGTEISAEVAVQETNSLGVERPLVRNLSTGHTISDLVVSSTAESELDNHTQIHERIASVSAANEIDLEAGEDRSLPLGTEIVLDIETKGRDIHVVENGDTAWGLYKKLGWQEAGYSFDEFSVANALVDRSLVMKGWEILYPQEIVAAEEPANILPDENIEEVVAEHFAEEGSNTETEAEIEGVTEAKYEQLSEEEAAEAVEQLMEFASSIVVEEDPFEPTQVTTLATQLETRAEEYVEALASGETNLAYVQGEVLTEALYSTSSIYTVEEAASLAVRQLYEKHGIEPTEATVNAAADELTAGLLKQNTLAKLLDGPEGVPFDWDSKTLKELESSITSELEIAREDVAVALDLLKIIDAEYINLSEEEIALVVGRIAEGRIAGNLRGDALYHVLAEGNDVSTPDDVYHLSKTIYDVYGAGALLETDTHNDALRNKILEALEGSEYLDVTQILDSVEQELEDLVVEEMIGIDPLVAEIDAVFGEKQNLSNVALTKLATEKILGASSDYLRMMMLTDIAHKNELELRDVVSGYYQQTFNEFGLGESLDELRLRDLVNKSLANWDFGSSESRINSELDAYSLVESMIAEATDELIDQVGEYLTKDAESEKLLEAAKTFINDGKPNDIAYSVELLSLLSADKDETRLAVEALLVDYFIQQGADKYLDNATLEEITLAVLNGHDPESFVGPLQFYSGNPEELFPQGEWFVLTDYEGQDLMDLVNSLGIEAIELTQSPLNDLVYEDGKLISNSHSIWVPPGVVSGDVSVYQVYLESIFSEPEVVEASVERSTIEQSLANVRIEDRVNYLDETTEAVKQWYQGVIDTDEHRVDGMPDGYVRMPFHNDIEGLGIAYTRSEKLANVETYAAPETIAVALGAAELWQQLIEENYPQYAGSMIRFRDFNSAHHRTHGDGRNIDLSTQLDASVTEASTGPAMDYISGDGTNNSYDFQLNVDYALALASFNIDGRRAISGILSSDANLVNTVNNALGWKFMSRADYHHEHWHVTLSKTFALDNFKPESPFDELGYKGDLGIGGEYIEPTQDMIEDEHGDYIDYVEEEGMPDSSLRESEETPERTTSSDTATSKEIKEDLPEIRAVSYEEVKDGDWGTQLNKEDFATAIIASVAEGNKPEWQDKGLLKTIVTTFWHESAGGHVNARGDTHIGPNTESNGICQVYYNPAKSWGTAPIRQPENNLNIWQHLNNCYTIYEQADNSMQPWSAYKNNSWKKYMDDFSPIVDELLEEYNLDW